MSAFMLVHYSKLSLEEIENENEKEFINITNEDLEFIKNDKISYIKYEEQVNMFFDSYKDEYLSTMCKVLAHIEEKTINF